ncbi:MAG: sulfur carrier protein ThiS [Candidatus Omnitrophica bacterium]|nr:sulfur carrier protein ThiS [Candidatus Omnitrophota bacterium]MBU2250628.1 sulfur carrier protein ThiS [Candidatus Omnitrophota bacterium]MBU2266213.1 sulfur carrier protein ThiS [Candidatus Omnitrophota bacterium]
MQVTVNGKPQTLSGGLSLLKLLSEKGLDKKRVVVELNLEIVPQEKMENTLIKEGDSIEIVSFVTGG